MSSTLLDTKTLSFLEILGNGRSYKVPPYQRDYSWREEHWEELWLDICEVSEQKDKRHYMGAVVLKAEDDRVFLIIDGQQRIATLTILGLAVIDRLNALATEDATNADRAQGLRSRFIGEKDPASLLEISKLVLNSHDNGFFQDYVVQGKRHPNTKSLTKSNRLLADCFAYFSQKIAESEFGSNGRSVAELLSEVVARRLLFIVIEVADDISAYTVFETLNARGLELTTTDLLKNYLFSEVNTKSDLDSLQRRWHALTEVVGQEKFGEFLRYHYLTKFPKIRSGRLFKLVRDEVKGPTQVMELMDRLEGRATIFEALNDSRSFLWTDNPEIRPLISELNLLGIKQATPLLMAAYEKLEPTELNKVVKLVCVMAFRYTTVGQLNPNEWEPACHYAAKAVLTGEATTARQVSEKLSSLSVNDEKFAADFAQRSFPTSGSKKRVTKYVLCRLESYFSNRAVDFETDPGTIEHIFPDNARSEWVESFGTDRFAEVVQRIGNLTLLSASQNRDCADSPYDRKVALYVASEYAITRDVAADAPIEWTVSHFDKRMEKLAKMAQHVWRSDFA